jgi:hypothetical protein
MLSQPLINAYFSALFSMTKSGHTFFTEAHSLQRDLCDPHISINELFEEIDRDPANTFELHLKSTAHRMLRHRHKEGK